MVGLIAIYLILNQSDPSLGEKLNPAGELRLRWNERFEEGHSRSALLARARGGIFPKLTSYLSLGAEVSSRSTNSDEIAFDDATSTKGIGLSQAFVELYRKGLWSGNLLLGKFILPSTHSPAFIDPEWRPEGAFESFQWDWTPNFKSALFAGQFSLGQTEESRFDGTSLARSWRFLQGASAQWNFDPESFLFFSVTNSWDQDATQALTDRSAERGNRFSGTVGSTAALTNSFAPLELYAQLSGRPIAIRSVLSMAFVWNPRSSDDQRAFWIQGEIGNLWSRRQVAADMSYLYSEPDVNLSALTDPEYGFLNRKGVRLRAHYFAEEFWRLGLTYLFADVMAPSVYQGRRHDLFAEMEVKF